MASALTKGQIKTEIKACLGNRTDFDTRMDAVLLLAIDNIARMHDWDELRFIATYQTAVTADPIADSQISLIQAPNRVRKNYSFRLYAGTESRKLIKLNPRRFDALLPKVDTTSRGKPTHYCIYNKNTLELWRVPDAVYTIKVRQSLYPEFPGDDANTFVYDNADDMIIFLSASYLALTAGNIQRSNELYKSFATAAAALIKEDIEDYDTHMAVHGTEIHGSITRGYDDPFVRSVSEY